MNSLEAMPELKTFRTRHLSRIRSSPRSSRLALYGPFTDEPKFVVCTDSSYADNTILIGSDARRVQAHYLILVDEGRKYGLELNASETSSEIWRASEDS